MLEARVRIHFIKTQAAGNDFILVDEFRQVVVSEEGKPEFVAKISDRHFGVGSDGVIFVQPSEDYDARFVFYNPDGSKAEMCGNGMRCFIKYVYEHGIARKQKITVDSPNGVMGAEPLVEDGVVKEVRVDMGAPYLRRKDIPVSGSPEDTFVDQEVKVNEGIYRITAVGMGNPHAVVFSDDLENINVREVGGRIRSMRGLFPNGVNVHFVQKFRENEFRIRTYERGVEDETLACGTGICASAVAAVLNKLADRKKPLIFHSLGGDLRIEFQLEEGDIIGIFMAGPVEEVFSGEIEYRVFK